LGPIEDELTPETPAAAFRDAPNQTTLALRPRPFTTQRTEDAALLERDELAATPAQQFLCSSAKLEPENHIFEQQLKSEVPDELNTTPTKQPMPSTRVLRSARQKTAPPVQKYSAIQPRDELAMTPAQRVRASPRKTKVAKQNAGEVMQFTECGERDELGVTPLPSRTLRSQPKQTSKTKNRIKLRTATLSVANCSRSPSDPTGKCTKPPLGARSANIMTAAKNGKKTASDDELRL
jgi:hypothetical protein